METVPKSDERLSYELKQSSIESVPPNSEHVYRKVQLLRNAGYAERFFSMTDPFQMELCARFVEVVHEVDPRCHILDIEGIRHVFISPEAKGLMEAVRVKIEGCLVGLDLERF